MCLEFLFKRTRDRRLPDAYTRPFDCSCEMCGSVFGDMQGLINHLGYHTTEELNSCIRRGYGTVRCNMFGKRLRQSPIWSVIHAHKEETPS